MREGIKRTNGNCGEWASTKSRRWRKHEAGGGGRNKDNKPYWGLQRNLKRKKKKEKRKKGSLEE